MPAVSLHSPSFKADMVFSRPEEDNVDKHPQLGLSVEEVDDDNDTICDCGNQFAHEDQMGQRHQNLPVKCQHFLEGVDRVAGTAGELGSRRSVKIICLPLI